MALRIRTLLLVVAFAVSVSASRILPAEMSIAVQHEEWMAKHGRVYSDATEKARRLDIFKANMDLIQSFNAGNHKFRLGANRFADLTNQEFRSFYTGYKGSSSSHTAPTNFRYANLSASNFLDWRKQGVVTPIKDQGECGACWAFSAVAATESINKITNGKLVSLSEQELVDCDVYGEDQGCSGGLMDDAFKFIIKNGGLTSEANYPYKSADGSCNTKKASTSAVKISSYEKVPSNDEAALLKAVTGQPVSVGIDGGDFTFQLYSGGVFDGPCGTDLDHGVAAIGYGTDKDGTKYWLVKNSWGTSWGENGYMRIEREVSAAEGLCGIAMQASYPTI